MTRKLELKGESLTRPPKGLCSEHPLIEDLKRKDFVTCRTIKPLVELTTKALGSY